MILRYKEKALAADRWGYVGLSNRICSIYGVGSYSSDLAFQSFGIEVSIAITGLAFLLSAVRSVSFLRITNWKKTLRRQRFGKK